MPIAILSSSLIESISIEVGQGREKGVSIELDIFIVRKSHVLCRCVVILIKLDYSL